MPADLFATARTRTRRERGAVLLVDDPVDVPRREWLRQHLAGRVRVLDMAPRADDPARAEDLRELVDLLGADLVRRPAGTAEAAARSADDGETLLVALEGTTCGGWARRATRGPTLRLPSSGPLLRSAGPRAVVVVHDAAELAPLVPWARLLAPDVEVALIGVLAADADAPGRVLADATALEAAVEVSRAALASDGRRVSCSVVVDEAPALDDASLVLTVERRGLLGRLLGRPAAVGRPRLLVPWPS